MATDNGMLIEVRPLALQTAIRGALDAQGLFNPGKG